MRVEVEGEIKLRRLGMNLDGLKVLKIGGSVITDKRRGAFEVLRERRLNEVCRAVADCRSNLILIHGVGSFGHPYVEKYGLENPLGVSRTHLGCLSLTNTVCRKLAEFDVAAIPLSPLPFLSDSDDESKDESAKSDKSSKYDFLLKLLEMGFIPVLHGDVVIKRGRVEVLSGDRILSDLCNNLPVKAAGFAIGADGVMVRGKLLPTIDYEGFLRLKKDLKFKRGKKSDVTGGIVGKLENAFRVKTDCRIFIFKGNYENVVKFLKGEKVGTEVVR